MVAVGAVIEHEPSGEVLLLKRAQKAGFAPGVWEDITGRMKQLEEPEQALRREVREETGLEISIVKPLRVFHIFRGARTPGNELVGILFWCKTQGKEVKLSEEHTEFRWLKPDEALHLLDSDGIKEDIVAYIKECGK